MVDEATVWDEIWPVIEQLITATLAEDAPAIEQFLLPGEQAAEALDLYGPVVFDILLKTVLGRTQLGMTRAIEADDDHLGKVVYVEYAWPDPASEGNSYTAIDVVTVQMVRHEDGWRVAMINPANADLPLNTPRAMNILAGAQVLTEDGAMPAEAWILPVALYGGLLQLTALPDSLQDEVEMLVHVGMQERSYGLLPLLYSLRLWRDFKAAASPDIDRPAGWAAAVEYIMSEQSLRDQTQAAVSRPYNVNLGMVAPRVKQLKAALDLDDLNDRYSELQTTHIVYKES